MDRRIARRTAMATALFVLVLASGCAVKNVSPDIEDDATITARVKTALLNDQQLATTRIDVTTVDGVVTLSGPLKSPTDEQRAVEIARRVAGVRDVRPAFRIAN
jgi:hyperosmotically inducible protein